MNRKRLKKKILVMYREIEIDRIQLTIMGVKFPNLAELERTANAIGSNMFEGFEPSRELVQLYIDWKSGAITESKLLAVLHAKVGK